MSIHFVILRTSAPGIEEHNEWLRDGIRVEGVVDSSWWFCINHQVVLSNDCLRRRVHLNGHWVAIGEDDASTPSTFSQKGVPASVPFVQHWDSDLSSIAVARVWLIWGCRCISNARINCMTHTFNEKNQTEDILAVSEFALEGDAQVERLSPSNDELRMNGTHAEKVLVRPMAATVPWYQVVDTAYH